MAMADFEQRDMSGSLFINKRKTTERHPDRNGSCMIDGTEYWVSGWLKKTKAGDPWLSLAFTPKEVTTESKSTPHDPDVDEDVPF
jgi:hypothetical protein